MDIAQPSNTEEVQAAVRELANVRVCGAGTKTAMSADANLSLAKLTGVMEYDPEEYTFTAKAATPVAEVRDLLAQHGQYLPFDPPLIDTGATLGGTLAAGLSGPGRFRFGGVRDFLLGVTFVNGEGEVVHGGGKVVKNAAGFDFPKLLVGSRGEFGLIVETTFKVFPEPKAYTTLVVDCRNLEDAAATMIRLAGSSLELTCLDLLPPHRLLLRVGGLAESMPIRVRRIREFLTQSAEILEGEKDRETWRGLREFEDVPENTTLLKIPIHPKRVMDVDKMFASQGDPTRRYSVGGNVAWVAWPDDRDASKLHPQLVSAGLSAVAVLGKPLGLFGRRSGQAFAQRIASVIDPSGKFARPSTGVNPEPATTR